MELGTEKLTLNNNIYLVLYNIDYLHSLISETWDIICYNQRNSPVPVLIYLHLYTELWSLSSISAGIVTGDIYTWHVTLVRDTPHATRDTRDSLLHVYLVAELIISVIVGGPEHVIIPRRRSPHGITGPRPSAVMGVAGARGSKAVSHLGVTVIMTIRRHQTSSRGHTHWSRASNICQTITNSPGGTERLLRLETVRSLGSSHLRCSRSLQSSQLKNTNSLNKWWVSNRLKVLMKVSHQPPCLVEQTLSVWMCPLCNEPCF